MSFYASIADYYDRIFPRDDEQIRCIESAFFGKKKRFLSVAENDEPKGRSLLDIGCGTGTILESLQPLFCRVAGLDLDRGLLSVAERKFGSLDESLVQLVRENMLNLPSVFPGSSFSLITCLGNTIPHVTSRASLEDFFRSVFARLDPGGMFIFQIMNYDRVLDSSVRSLPTINGDGFSFERLYSIPDHDGLIDFRTILRDPGRDLVLDNSVKLFPLRRSDAERFITGAGFRSISFYGDYAGSPWAHDSPLLVGVCR